MTTPSDSKEQLPYQEVVNRLQSIVQQLEGGQLSLEAALDKFSEGVQLVKTGERILNEAEQRIEQLLGDGTTVPLAPVASSGAGEGAGKKKPRTNRDDDVSF